LEDLTIVDGLHVDASYNKSKDTYVINSECLNCRRRYTIRRVRGYSTAQDCPACPNCGCNGWRALADQGPN